MKKLLSVLLILSIVLCSVPALAATTTITQSTKHFSLSIPKSCKLDKTSGLYMDSKRRISISVLSLDDVPLAKGVDLSDTLQLCTVLDSVVTSQGNGLITFSSYSKEYKKINEYVGAVITAQSGDIRWLEFALYAKKNFLHVIYMSNVSLSTSENEFEKMMETVKYVKH